MKKWSVLLCGCIVCFVAVFSISNPARAAGAAFSDVSPEASYAQAVNWCAEQGLMNGVGNGRFDPDGTLTRSMLATVIYRHAGSPAVSGLPDFSDVAADAWCSDAVIWVSVRGILRGYGNRVFGTNDPVSIEQLDVILDRYQGLGDTWVGDPSRAGAASRAQIAVALMERLHIESELSRNPAQGNSLGFLLYTPADPTPHMPLVVYLHGGSGKGNDLTLVTGGSLPKSLIQGDLGQLPAFVLMPQLPAAVKGWSDVTNQLAALIDEVCGQHQIDPARVSLTGHSMGGTGAWAVAASMPARFSCVVPLSGSIRYTTATAEALSGLPVWAVAGEKDTIVDPASSRAMVDALREAGADATLTILPDADHFDVPDIYLNEEFGVIEWMLAQRK